MASTTRSRDYMPHKPFIYKDVDSTIKKDKDKFQISIDVHHFTAEDIKVATADGFLIVEGKHEEKRDDDGFISRQFTRSYVLPDGCEPETVQSKMTSDGMLIVTAPRNPETSYRERIVPVIKSSTVTSENTEQVSKADED